MMTFFIVLFTALLILDCLFLGLLILIQLPKKEAGAGVAFGGGAADALFGAGSGTALTKLTKYSAGFFFILVVLLSGLNIRARHSGAAGLRKVLESPSTQQSAAPATTPVVPAATPAPNASPASNAPALILGSNAFPSSTPPPAAPATNSITNAPAGAR